MTIINGLPLLLLWFSAVLRIKHTTSKKAGQALEFKSLRDSLSLSQAQQYAPLNTAKEVMIIRSQAWGLPLVHSNTLTKKYF